MKYSLEHHRRVYDDENGCHLTIRPSADFPDTNVLLMTEESEEEFLGKIHLDLPAPMMRLLGQALIDTANEVEKQGA